MTDKNFHNEFFDCQLGLDVFICNAGSGDPKTLVKLREMPMDKYMQLFTLNYFCPVVMTKEVLPHLEKTRGNIVYVSSIYGKIAKLHTCIHV